MTERLDRMFQILEAVPADGRVDLEAAEQAARDVLAAIGADLADEGLRETPARVARAFMELLTCEPFDLTTFLNTERCDELVVVRSIPFHSLCMHHLLPFHGVATVAYVPGERILGLSKLARIVDLFARDLQVQERLTVQVADYWRGEPLRPKGVGVVLEAEHMCMSLRGVQKPGACTVTSALHGVVRDDLRTREEFLAFAGIQPLAAGGCRSAEAREAGAARRPGGTGVPQGFRPQVDAATCADPRKLWLIGVADQSPAYRCSLQGSP
jgi:GTP cyclohydrolase I